VKGLQCISESGCRSSGAKREPPNLPTPTLDFSRATYLSVPEAVTYLRFSSRDALYRWVRRYRIPKCGTGRVLFLRRDLDEAMQERREDFHPKGR
jgi:hypothetical protein